MFSSLFGILVTFRHHWLAWIPISARKTRINTEKHRLFLSKPLLSATAPARVSQFPGFYCFFMKSRKRATFGSTFLDKTDKNRLSMLDVTIFLLKWTPFDNDTLTHLKPGNIPFFGIEKPPRSCCLAHCSWHHCAKTTKMAVFLVFSWKSWKYHEKVVILGPISDHFWTWLWPVQKVPSGLIHKMGQKHQKPWFSVFSR